MRRVLPWWNTLSIVALVAVRLAGTEVSQVFSNIASELQNP